LAVLLYYFSQSAPLMGRENIAPPTFYNNVIIYKNCVSIPVP